MEPTTTTTEEHDMIDWTRSANERGGIAYDEAQEAREARRAAREARAEESRRRRFHGYIAEADMCMRYAARWPKRAAQWHALAADWRDTALTVYERAIVKGDAWTDDEPTPN